MMCTATDAVLKILCTLCFVTRLASAYPSYWYDSLDQIGVELPGLRQCDAHPTDAVNVPGLDSPHTGVPTTDRSIGFTFADDQSGNLTMTLCPGRSHRLTLSFTEARLALLTANTSAIAFTSPTPTSTANTSCPNRVDLGKSLTFKAARNFTATFSVPCSLEGQAVLFTTTSAAKASQAPWKQATTLMTVSPGAACGTCTSAAAASSNTPPPHPTPPHPTPPQSGEEKEGQVNDEDEDEDAKVALAQLSPANASTCSPSNLGYTCSTIFGKVTVHWSVNTTTAPSNPCTAPTNRTTLSASQLVEYGTLHMAVEAAVTGYVAIGFNPTSPSAMYPADIAFGWATSIPSFNTYYTKESNLGANDVEAPSWAYDSNVVRNASAGITTICFSRRLVDSRAKASPDLRAATGSGNTSNSSRRSRRLMASSDASPAKLGINWAISDTANFVQHRAGNAGGGYLDLVSGTQEDGGGTDEEYWINVHGALMAVAWGLLLPLGTLLPAHRWLLGDTKVAGKHLWFWMHIVCQWTGMALFIAGFVVAFVKFDVEGTLAEAHGNIGIAIMAAAGAQVVLAYVRPDPNAKNRGLWNLLHHNLGRATVLLAWANVYIGIVVYHTDLGEEYAPWIAPISIVMGLLLLATLILRLVGPSNTGVHQNAQNKGPGDADGANTGKENLPGAGDGDRAA